MELLIPLDVVVWLVVQAHYTRNKSEAKVSLKVTTRPGLRSFHSTGEQLWAWSLWPAGIKTSFCYSFISSYGWFLVEWRTQFCDLTILILLSMYVLKLGFECSHGINTWKWKVVVLREQRRLCSSLCGKDVGSTLRPSSISVILWLQVEKLSSDWKNYFWIYLLTLEVCWPALQWTQQRPVGCLVESNVPVYGLPQHQAVLFVEVVLELGNSSVRKVVKRLQRAVVQGFVLPLSQNQQTLTPCRHNLHKWTRSRVATIISYWTFLGEIVLDLYLWQTFLKIPSAEISWVRPLQLISRV